MDLKNEFIEMMAAHHPLYHQGLLDALDHTPSTTTIRHHLLKSDSIPSEGVPWCGHAEYLEERRSFTLDPLLHGGAYYVQDASSMFIYYVLNFLQIPKDGKLLDLCGAPGGKSTLILDYLQNEGLLITNEVIKSRANILQENIIKWGYSNAIVTNNDPADFSAIVGYFDFILIDAPCSGEGMFRKDHSARQEWSVDHVELCSSRQRRIIDDIIPSLKNDGYIIYCTCTFNHDENINNVLHFIEQYKMESIKLTIPVEWGIVELNVENASGYQFFPSHVQGEGFFISVLKRKEGVQVGLKQPKISKLKPMVKSDFEIIRKWVSEGIILMQNSIGNIYAYNDLVAEEINKILSILNVRHSGVLVGNIQKNVFIPNHNLALSKIVGPDVPIYEMELDEAKHFLHKSLPLIEDPKQGWLLARYKGIGLGWLKNLGNRINNYYPSEWRIRMDINKQ